MSDLKLNGRLQDEPLPHLLHTLLQAKATGVLRLEAKAGKHELFAREGYPVSVSLPGAAELLGKVLVEMGIIDDATHKRTLQEPPPKGLRYGQYLVQKGIVSPEHMRLALKAQVRRKLHRLFFLNEGQFSFLAGEHQEGMEQHESLRIHPWRAIYQGVRSAWSAERLADALVLLDGKILKCVLEDAAVARYGVGPDDGRAAEMLRKGYFTLPDLISGSGVPAQPAHALVYALWVTEGLDVKSDGEPQPSSLKTPEPSGAPQPNAQAAPVRMPAAPVRMSSGSYVSPDVMRNEIRAKAEVVETESLFAVLGVSEKAGKDAVKTAYLEAAKRYHPDRLTSLGLEGLRPEVEKIFRRVSDAYATLYDDARREEYTKTQGQPQGGAAPDAHDKAMKVLKSEMAFQRGEVLLRQNDYPGAVRELEQAVRGNPEEGESVALLAWASVCAGQLSWAEAKPRLTEATKLSPRCGRAFFYLGLALKEEGDLDRAYAAFKKAHDLDQRLVDAEREIRLIHMRREKKPTKSSGGIFDRFRKK